MVRNGSAAARLILSLAIMVVAGAVFASGASAQERREHVVRPGDTLWEIARAYLSNPFLWPLIYEANRAAVENPHLIHPDERLVIPELVIKGADPSEPLMPPVAQEPAPPRERSRFYEEMAQDTAAMRVELESRQVPYAVTPSEWRAVPWIQDSASLGVQGRLVRLADPTTEDHVLPSSLHPFQQVRIGRLQSDRFAAGDSVLVVRLGDKLKGWGQVIQPMAILRIDTVGSTVATGTVVKQFGYARIGDVVMPLPSVPALARGEPQPVTTGPQGLLLWFLEPQPHFGPPDIGFVDLGRGELSIGDELLAYVPERRMASSREEMLPDTPVGTLRVVRVEDRTATVRVVGVDFEAMERGLPVRLVRRMP